MGYQQGFGVGVYHRRRPIEGSGDHFAVVEHGGIVVDLVAAGKRTLLDEKVIGLKL